MAKPDWEAGPASNARTHPIRFFDDQGNPRSLDESTWLADETSFTNNVQAQLGLSVFLPFTWEYRLPK